MILLWETSVRPSDTTKNESPGTFKNRDFHIKFKIRKLVGKNIDGV